jgi:hypothetical protein
MINQRSKEFIHTTWADYYTHVHVQTKTKNKKQTITNFHIQLLFIQDALLQLTRHSDLGSSRGSARLEQYLRGSGSRGSWIHGGQVAQVAVRVGPLGFLLGLYRQRRSQTQHGGSGRGSSRIYFETGWIVRCL